MSESGGLIVPPDPKASDGEKGAKGPNQTTPIPGTSCPFRTGTYSVMLPGAPTAGLQVPGRGMVTLNSGPVDLTCVEECQLLLGPNRKGGKRECALAAAARGMRSLVAASRDIGALAAAAALKFENE